MRKIFKALQLFSVLGGLAFFALNFANPKIAKESLKTISAPLQSKLLESQETVPEVAAGAPAVPKKYVKIDGKLYEYNPRHTYTVDGIQTMYKNGNPKTLEQLKAENEAAAALAANALGEDLGNNVLSVYTPSGAQAVIDGAREAAAKVEKRNRALDDLDAQ